MMDMAVPGVLILACLASACSNRGQIEPSDSTGRDPHFRLANAIKSAVSRYRVQQGTHSPAFLVGFEDEEYRRLGDTLRIGEWAYSEKGMGTPRMSKRLSPFDYLIIDLAVDGDSVVVTRAGEGHLVIRPDQLE